jgi:hypothetical protein
LLLYEKCKERKILVMLNLRIFDSILKESSAKLCQGDFHFEGMESSVMLDSRVFVHVSEQNSPKLGANGASIFSRWLSEYWRNEPGNYERFDLDSRPSMLGT